MMARHSRSGRVEAIYLRPARREDIVSVQSVECNVDGLRGDHAKAGLRAVTLIQKEHLAVIASLAGLTEIDPRDLRRNVLVSRINLLALRKKEVQVGDLRLRISGPCPPCSRMEEILGPGGYSAMRGHGGVYAEVLKPGRIAIADSLQPLPNQN